MRILSKTNESFPLKKSHLTVKNFVSPRGFFSFHSSHDVRMVINTLRNNKS